MSACNLSSLYTNSPACYNYVEQLADDYTSCQDKSVTEQKIAAPMVWIGIYVSAASVVCLLAVAADTFHSLNKKIHWVPCKYFTLNAASLTLLAVAMKLPMDLSNSMPGHTDQLAKLTSMVFMCIMMGSFMPSLGAMGDKEILMNLAALDILVITLLVNVGIQLGTGAIDGYSMMKLLHVVVMISMFMLLVILNVTALTVPTFRKILELKYGEIHKVASNEGLNQNGMVNIEKLRENVTKFWMMSKTGSPEFVITRFATCSASGTICFLVALVFVGIEIIPGFWFREYSSDYKWSTFLIFVTQSIGVVVGTIAPTSRWLTATIFKCSKKGGKHEQKVFKVESYWIQRLLDWKWSPLPLEIRNQKFRKLVQNTKILLLDVCIGLQKVAVVTSKAARCPSIFIVSLIISCCCCCCCRRSNMISEAEFRTELDLKRYVLQIEGEEEVPERTLRNIFESLNNVIEMGKRKQPRHLAELLKKSTVHFEGMAKFNCNEVPSLHSEEPPNCWSLSVVTLSSIIIALPNISSDGANRLLCSVREGLLYIRQIEKSLDTKGDLVNARKAADYVSLGVELYRKWLAVDLQEMALKGETSKENLNHLAAIAKKTVTGFMREDVNEGLDKNPLNWPLRVIAANSMYRISQTIMLDYQESDHALTDDKLFENISVMIADIMAACLTNLPRLIISNSHCSSIEKQEESVKNAARLLGETEEILEILQQLELPNINADQVPYIDEWSSIVKQQSPSGNISSSFGKDKDSSGSDELHIDVEY